MIFTPNQTTEVLSRLLGRTQNGSLRWSGGITEDSVSTRFGDYHVIVSRRKNDHNAMLTLSDIDTRQTYRLGTSSVFATASNIAEIQSVVGVTLNFDVSKDQQFLINELFNVATGGETFMQGLLKALG